MFFELFYWDVTARFRRFPLLLGGLVIVGYLVAQSLSQYSAPGSTPLTATVLALGRVRSFAFVLILIEVVGFRAIYSDGSIHILMRSGSRHRYWLSRLLGTFTVSGLFAMLLILVDFSINVLVGRLSPSVANVTLHNALIVQYGSLSIMFLLLSVGIASILLLIDVLQALLSNTFLAYVLVAALQIISLSSHALLTGTLARLTFLLSPFLRLSLIENYSYHEQPVYSIGYLLLFLVVESLLGWRTICRRSID